MSNCGNCANYDRTEMKHTDVCATCVTAHTNNGRQGPSNWEPIPMTNADRIRAMSDEELADFLCSIAYARNTPWSGPFARKFCDNCPTTEGAIQETGQTMEFNECDFVDGKCPHGSDVVWWLQQPAEEATHAQ